LSLNVTPNYVALCLPISRTAVVRSSVALWQRRNRDRPPPIRAGVYVVRWSLTLRLMNCVFFVMMLTACAFFIWAKFATDENVPGAIWVLVTSLLVLSSCGPLSWRVRTEYNETSLTYPRAGQPRQYALSDFTRAGPISWRGHEFSTQAGDKICVNSYQTGGSALIELLQRGVKETYCE